MRAALPSRGTGVPPVLSRHLWGPLQRCGASVGPPPSVRPSLRARGAGANGSSSWFCRGRGGPGRLRLEQLVSSFLRSRRRLRLHLPPRTRKCHPASAEPGTGGPTGAPPGACRATNGSALFPAQAGNPPSRALPVRLAWFF